VEQEELVRLLRLAKELRSYIDTYVTTSISRILSLTPSAIKTKEMLKQVKGFIEFLPANKKNQLKPTKIGLSPDLDEAKLIWKPYARSVAGEDISEASFGTPIVAVLKLCGHFAYCKALINYGTNIGTADVVSIEGQEAKLSNAHNFSVIEMKLDGKVETFECIHAQAAIYALRHLRKLKKEDDIEINDENIKIKILSIWIDASADKKTLISLHPAQLSVPKARCSNSKFFGHF